MARLYVGNLESVDRPTLDALRRLPDDFTVLAEFRIPRSSRQVDFFIARVDQPTCSLFLIEVKNESRRLKGTVDGVWEYEDDTRPGAWLPYPPPNDRDQNPLQQAINTANTLKDWIMSMQAILQGEDPPWDNPRENLTVFPRLLLPNANPLNQLQTDRFAFRFDSFDQAIDGLQRFRGRRPFPISRQMVDRMAENLGLPLYLAPPSREPEPLPRPVSLAQVAAQVTALQRDVYDIKRLLQQLAADRAAPRVNGHDRDGRDSVPLSERSAPNGGSPDRDAAFNALVTVLREFREAGQLRMFSAVHDEVRQRYGDLPNDLIPFDRFKDFVQEAQRRGKIRLVRLGPVDHLLLSDEAIPPYVDMARREPEPPSAEPLGESER